MNSAKEIIDDFFGYLQENYFKWLPTNHFTSKLPSEFDIFKSELNKTSIENIDKIEVRKVELQELMQNAIQGIDALYNDFKQKEVSKIAQELKKLFEKTDIFFEEKNNTDEIELFWTTFKNLCEGECDELYCKEFIFPDSIQYEARIELPQKTHLINCKFECKVKFVAKDTEQEHSINLENSEFNQETTFYYFTINGINISKCIFKENLIFEKVTFDFFDPKTFYETGEEYKKLQIFECKKTIHFDQCKFNENNLREPFLIEEATIGGISIIQNEQEENQLCKNICLRNLNIDNTILIQATSNHESQIEIQNIKPINAGKIIYIAINGTKNTDLYMDNTDCKVKIASYGIMSIYILNANISGDIQGLARHKACIQKIKLENIEIVDDLIISASKIKEIAVLNANIDAWLKIEEDENLTQNNSLQIKNVGIENGASIKIGNGKQKKYKTISLDEIDNSGNINIIGAQIAENINITHSTMGNTELHRIKMSDGAKATISDSSIAKMRFYNFIWCPLENINTNLEGFRQLKYAYEDQKNMIEAARFYAKELDVYHKEIKHNKATSKEREDSIMLWFSDKLSNHGLSWAKPLSWMILISIIAMHTSTIFLVKPIQIAGALLSMMVIVGWFSMIHKSLDKNETIKAGILIASIFSTVTLSAYLLGINEIDVAINFINPFSADFKAIYENCQNMEKWQKITMFLAWILYKIFFTLTGYHMIVALKRITKF